MHRIPEFFQARFSEQRLVAGVGRLQYRDAASQVLPTAKLVDKGCLVGQVIEVASVINLSEASDRCWFVYDRPLIL